MISKCFICLALTLTIRPAVPLLTQIADPLTTMIAQDVKGKEAAWKYTPGHCTCPPLVKGQLSQDVGQWVRDVETGKQEYLFMDVYRIGTVKEAATWMSLFGKPVSGSVCQKQKYKLGDEAYLLSCPDDHISVIYLSHSVYCRKRNVIVRVRGERQETVERFAKYAVGRLPASNNGINRTRPQLHSYHRGPQRAGYAER